MPITKLGPDETIVSCGTGDVCLSLSMDADQTHPTSVLFHPVPAGPAGEEVRDGGGPPVPHAGLPRVYLEFGSRASLEVVIGQLRAGLDGWPADPAEEE